MEAINFYDGYEVIENPVPPLAPVPPSHGYKGGLCPPNFLTCCEEINYGCTSSALDWVKRVAFHVNGLLEQRERFDTQNALKWESFRINEVSYPSIESSIRTTLGILAVQIGGVKSQAVLNAKEGVYSYDLPKHFSTVTKIWDGCKFLENSTDVMGVQSEAACNVGSPSQYAIEGNKLFLNRKPEEDMPLTVYYEANSFMIDDCTKDDSAFKLLDGFDPIQQIQSATMDMVLSYVGYKYLFDRGGDIQAMFINNYQDSQSMLFKIGVQNEKKVKAKKRVYKPFSY